MTKSKGGFSDKDLTLSRRRIIKGAGALAAGKDLREIVPGFFEAMVGNPIL